MAPSEFPSGQARRCCRAPERQPQSPRLPSQPGSITIGSADFGESPHALAAASLLKGRRISVALFEDVLAACMSIFANMHALFV